MPEYTYLVGYADDIVSEIIPFREKAVSKYTLEDEPFSIVLRPFKDHKFLREISSILRHGNRGDVR